MTTSIRSKFTGRTRVAIATLAIATVGLSIAPAAQAQAVTKPSTTVVATAPGSAKNIARVSGPNLYVTPANNTWAKMKGGSSKSIVITLTNKSKKNITVAPNGLGIQVLPGTGTTAARGVVNARMAKTVLKPGKSAYALVVLVAPKKGTTAAGLRTDIRFIAK